MRTKRIYSLLWCVSIAIVAFVLLDAWSALHAPVYKRFERKWADDVRLLEESKKLPRAWFDVREVELIGGNPETKAWLRKIKIPVKVQRKEGRHKVEVLVVAWQADGQRGALVQYNLVDLKTNNMVAELARTIMLTEAGKDDPIKNFLQELWP